MEVEEWHVAAFFFLGEGLPEGLAAVGVEGAEGVGFSEPLHHSLAETSAVGEIVDGGEGAGVAVLFDNFGSVFAEAGNHAKTEAEDGGGSRIENRGVSDLFESRSSPGHPRSGSAPCSCFQRAIPIAVVHVNRP